MSFLIASMVFCALLLANTSAVPAQSDKQATAKERKSEHKTKVELRYDKKRDETTAWLEPLVVWSATGEGRSPDSIELSAAFTYPKHTIAIPKTVTIRIYAQSRRGRQFTHDRKLVVTADDVRLNLGEMELKHSVGDRTVPQIGGEAWAYEMLELPIPYETWLQIAKAKKVNVQIGHRKFDVSDKHLQSLSNFAELMQQEGQEFKE